tara:strand:- start:93 stop:395 length:303 start_codon:yes stop_codon:yes gene_type:complete
MKNTVQDRFEHVNAPSEPLTDFVFMKYYPKRLSDTLNAGTPICMEFYYQNGDTWMKINGNDGQFAVIQYMKASGKLPKFMCEEMYTHCVEEDRQWVEEMS